MYKSVTSLRTAEQRSSADTLDWERKWIHTFETLNLDDDINNNDDINTSDLSGFVHC